MLSEAPKGQGVRVDTDKRVLLNIVPTDVAETAELRVGTRVEGERSPTLTPELFPENKESALSTAKTAPLQLIRSPAAEPVEPLPATPPAPAPRRTGLLVLLSMGGGVLLGSGAMTAITILGLMLAGVGATIVLLLWFAGASPALVAVEMPVVVPATATENPAAEVPVADIVTPANDASAGGPSPIIPSIGDILAAPKTNPAVPAVAGTTPPAARPPAAPVPASASPASAAPAPAPAAPAPAPAAPAPASAAPAPASAAPAPASAAPAPASSASGLVPVKILSDPPAALLAVDGRPQGRTPTKLDLEPGTHSITLTAGSSKGTFSIDVAPGDDKFCYGLSGKKLVRTSCD